MTFGILHSRFHEAWSLRLGTSLEDRPRYTPTTTFETFPFPDGLTPNTPATDYESDPRARTITEAAKRLVELRDRWLNPPEWVDWVDEPVPGYPKRPVPRDEDAAKALKKRTLTNLYNARPQWLAHAHAALDAAIASAYGWPADISDDAFLISKLPAPEEEDLSKGILDAIDMDSYRVEKRAVQQILLPDENAEIEPVPPIGGGHVPVPELERLSSILREFNDLFGAIAWQDTDRVKEMITETIPFRVAQDAAFKNARQNSDQDNARIEHGKVLTRVMTALIKDDAELFKQFMDNDSFKRWMTETVFTLACKQAS